MVEVNKSVLVAHSASCMFALVDAAESYPEFLPWCGGARLIFRDANTTRATLEINYHGVRLNFTTENSKREPESMQIRLIEGPFRMLEGCWRFSSLGASGCKVELSLRYEFASRLLDKVVGPVFGHIANNLVEAFVKRARSIHG